MTPGQCFANLGPHSKVAKSISARVVRTTRTLCDDITSCESLIAKLPDFGKTRTGAALMFDPEAAFGLKEADPPDDTIAQLSEDSDYQFNRVSVKRTFSDTIARLEQLSNNHFWAYHDG